MQNFISDTFARLGVANASVFLQTVNKRSVIAAALGVKIDLLGIGIIGLVLVNEKQLRRLKLNDGELKFVLAHECVHIFKNHIITTAFWNLLERYLKGENNEHYDVVEAIKVVLLALSPDRLPPNAVNLRDQEYEADELAARLTGDLDAAISCLTKLVKGDLSKPSHVWELFGQVVPAMNMRKRIDMLRSCSPPFSGSII
jgi:Zn-dependent protease with chaperone function